jgi:uncharacterized membrane protein YeiH
VLAGVPSILLRPEIYVTAAALAAALFIVLVLTGVPPLIASTVGATTGFRLPGLAITRGLSIPAYTSEPHPQVLRVTAWSCAVAARGPQTAMPVIRRQ